MKSFSRFQRSLLPRGVLIAFAIAGAMSLRSPRPATADTTTYVRIVGFDFEPRDIAIPPGTTVIFSSPYGGQHTFTSVTGLFDTGVLLIDDRVPVEFPEAGTFPYVCNIHSDMRGSITVAANAPLPPEPAWVRETPRAPVYQAAASTAATAPVPAAASSSSEAEGTASQSAFPVLAIAAIALVAALLTLLVLRRSTRN